MKFHVPRIVLLGLFAFAAMGSASATQMKASTPATAPHVAAPQAPRQAVDNPWTNLASTADLQSAPLLAHDDRYWHDHDGRWHDRRGDWRRDHWRREQARRAAERRRDWERHHYRAMHHRYDRDYRDYDRRYYRR
ncbi:hypothetical protein ODI84_03620 [Pseudomonas putida]|uniref:hypothetical protein n=1 Tax=Pseudomonas putida TaxID=303 RepID=UPI002D1F994C|nr:hypothetical protein [Pseudomonas putida]MEB3899268.1 hypothetical protein [Pseudomonas putida]